MKKNIYILSVLLLATGSLAADAKKVDPVKEKLKKDIDVLMSRIKEIDKSKDSPSMKSTSLVQFLGDIRIYMQQYPEEVDRNEALRKVREAVELKLADAVKAKWKANNKSTSNTGVVVIVFPLKYEKYYSVEVCIDNGESEWKNVSEKTPVFLPSGTGLRNVYWENKLNDNEIWKTKEQYLAPDVLIIRGDEYDMHQTGVLPKKLGQKPVKISQKDFYLKRKVSSKKFDDKIKKIKVDEEFNDL